MAEADRSKDDTEQAEPVAPLGHARGRQMPGVIVLSDTGAVVFSNNRAFEMLRDVGTPQAHESAVLALPPVLAALVPQLRSRLRDRADTSTAALLTVDLCVRACHLAGQSDRHLLLVLERVQRRDAVAQNLERFALSPRECDVVMLILYGHSNRRIADQLFLTEYTVEDHLKRIFAKLAVKSRTALAAKILGWRESE